MPLTSRFVIGLSLILLGIGFFALSTIIGTTVWLSEKSNSFIEASVQSRALRASAVELRSALQSAESSQRGYLVGGNEIYLAPYDAAKAQALTQFEHLKRLLPSSPRNSVMLDQLSKITPEKLGEMDQTIALKTKLQDGKANAIFRSNSGKALMDKANLFLSSIIRQTDDQLEAIMKNQQQNATLLRLATVVGGFVILLVVGAATATVFRYAWERAQARNELFALNLTLEDRVTRRTNELTDARDKAELLVVEVNHRVANSLALVASMVHLQANLVTEQASKDALKETEARIFAVASVHRRLYTGGNSRFVDLQEYLSGVLDNVDVSMQGRGHSASLRYELEPVKLKTDFSVNLGVIVTEWVTNAFKYAYPEKSGEVRVRLRRLADGKAELSVEDDGVGRRDGIPKGTGLGTRIVNAMARSIDGKVDYIAGDRGTVARLAFPALLDS